MLRTIILNHLGDEKQKKMTEKIVYIFLNHLGDDERAPNSECPECQYQYSAYISKSSMR